MFREKAKGNQNFATGGDRKSEDFRNQGSQNSVKLEIKKIDTQKEIAKLAGVSHDTIDKKQLLQISVKAGVQSSDHMKE